MEQEKQCYWNGNGKYQEEYSDLYKELVPSEGQAETLHGELIRAITRLFHEYCNNGNCNAQERTYKTILCDYCNGDGEGQDGEECSECEGTGEGDDEHCDIEVSDRYQVYLDLIEKYVPDTHECLGEIESIIVTDFNYGSKDQFSDKRIGSYNTIMNAVMECVLNSENQPLPVGDKQD